MDPVHRVVPHQLSHPFHHISRRLGDGRVQVQAPVHLHHPLGVGVGQIVFRQLGRGGGGGPEPVGVDPSFHRQAPAVGLGEEEVQGVKPRVHPLGAGADVAPGIEGAGIEGIPEGPHLEQDGIQPQGGALVRHGCRPGAEGLRRAVVHPLELQITDPYRPVFPGGGVRVSRLHPCGPALLPQPEGPGPYGGRSRPRQKGPAGEPLPLVFLFPGSGPGACMVCVGHLTASLHWCPCKCSLIIAYFSPGGMQRRWKTLFNRALFWYNKVYQPCIHGLFQCMQGLCGPVAQLVRAGGS